MQGQLKVLAKPRKERTDEEIARLVSAVRDSFKEYDLDDKTVTSITAAAEYEVVRQGQYVFHQGEVGDRLYIVLHGEAHCLIKNPSYLMLKREMMQIMKQVYDELETEHALERKKPKHMDRCEDDTLFLDLVRVKEQILHHREKLRKLNVQLRALTKYSKVAEYTQGGSFGELSLMYNEKRNASILAVKNSYFLTIHIDVYQSYIKRYEKKMKDKKLDFFKQVPFLKGLSDKAIHRMTLGFTTLNIPTAGTYVLREGEPVTHVALVREGEFEVVKKSLQGLDQRIMSFLRKSDLPKQI